MWGFTYDIIMDAYIDQRKKILVRSSPNFANINHSYEILLNVTKSRKLFSRCLTRSCMYNIPLFLVCAVGPLNHWFALQLQLQLATIGILAATRAYFTRKLSFISVKIIIQNRSNLIETEISSLLLFCM